MKNIKETTKNSNFLPVVLLISAGLIGLFYLLGYSGFITPDHKQALITALLITFLNFLIGYFSIRAGLRRKDQMFLGIVLGGMVFRLFLMLAAIFLSMKLLKVSDNYYIFSVFIFYFLYLILEIYYLLTKAIKNTG